MAQLNTPRVGYIEASQFGLTCPYIAEVRYLNAEDGKRYFSVYDVITLIKQEPMKLAYQTWSNIPTYTGITYKSNITSAPKLRFIHSTKHEPCPRNNMFRTFPKT